MTLYKLDPRSKLAAMLALSTAALISREAAQSLGVLALTFLVLLLDYRRVGAYIRSIKGLLGLVFSLFLLQCVFNRAGEPLLVLGEVVVLRQAGFVTACIVSLRIVVIILAALIVRTGETRDYLLALTQWKIPYEIAFMVMTALRFIPMLREEATDVLAAMQMRGTRIKGAGLRARIRIYMSAATPIVAGAIRRAEQMSVAMEARSFRRYPHRTSMRKISMRAVDWCFSLAVIAATAALMLVL